MENPKEGVFRPLRCLRSRSSSCFVSGGFFPYSWRRLYYTHRKGSGSRSLDRLITHQRGTLWHHNEQPAETTKEECRNSQIHSERLELSTAQTTITVNEMVSPLSIHILEHLAKENSGWGEYGSSGCNFPNTCRETPWAHIYLFWFEMVCKGGFHSPIPSPSRTTLKSIASSSASLLRFCYTSDAGF